MTEEEFLNGRLIVTVGDLVKQQVDAIVNAANSSLLGGGGVDGAIHWAAGPVLHTACQELRRTQYPDGLETGGAVITTGGDLAARFVIHTVGPIYGQHHGAEPDLLAACYRNSLNLAAQHNLHAVAFPAISTGAYGYPVLSAGRIAARTVADFLAAEEKPKEVRLVFFQKREADQLLNDNEFRTSLGIDGEKNLGSND